MKALFWFSLAVVAYVYVGYPLLLALWARLGARPARRAPLDARAPGASVIVAARNEAHRLPARVSNLLQQDYPGPIQIVVVSDGSTDGTAAALEPFGSRIELVEIPASGKPSALNAGVARARYDILVFADARQSFAPDVLRSLVENFADPAVGAVTGELLLDCECDRSASRDSTVGESVGAYWRYEKWLRRQESAIWSTLGATGAIYALRRDLWKPLPPAALLDDVLAPMRVVLAGYRVVFDDRAKAYDRVEPDAAGERRRKVRTLAGNYQILAIEPALLNPLGNRVWLQYLSHKLGRLVVPYAMALLFLANLMLAPAGVLYMAALLAQLGFYALALYGAWLERRTEHTGRAAAAVAVRAE
jgi:cellulose synthase/poly-beta-1,6-N-acetylglucosamine synthase-like glycosyltransferase